MSSQSSSPGCGLPIDRQLCELMPSHLCSCADTLEAVILYPSLGMPMVLGEGQEKCSLIMATGADALGLFGVAGDDCANKACEYIDRHLRLTPIDKPKFGCARDTTRGHLCDDGNIYNVASGSVQVWHLGTIKDGMLIANRHSPLEGGRERKDFPIAVLAPRLIGPESPYKCLSELWEVEIDLDKAKLAGKITTAEFMNWAWLVETTDAHRCNHEGNYFVHHYDATYHEPQDRMIDDYLAKLVKSDRHYAHSRLFEADLSRSEGRYPSLLEGQNYEQRLQSWHPVIRATKFPLKLGHLTDIHVNVRQDALSRSKAKVIEDISGHSVGDKVAHAFWTTRELIRKMAEKKQGVDTALLLTGDYIDFNRNINPGELASSIGGQWKQYNLLANEEENGLYLRGIDCTLMYSLVRQAYTEHKLPVFMVSGNHEGYPRPYGISPRVTGWALGLGVLELGLLKKVGVTTEEHKKKREAASEWVNLKADAGIPANHNLTIYEATLAYGPTYGQMLTTDNFTVAQLDWFHTLFTPFSDALLTLGSESEENGADAKQILALLGWGGAENYKSGNLGDSDVQGLAILPRAVTSFSKAQKLLLGRATELKGKNKAPVVLGSHFTMVNYEQNTPLNSRNVAFAPPSPGSRALTAVSPATGLVAGSGFNKANWGTCEQGQYRFYKDIVFSGKPIVDWHISGHSHRAGVYQVEENARSLLPSEVKVKSAYDPGLQGGKIEPGTCFVVSSSAGAMGIQNLKGEFGGWFLRPPSGSWIDVKEKTVEQVKTVRVKMNEKPRLCVILDYVAVMNPGKAVVPIRFAEREVQPFEKGTIEFWLSNDEIIRNCINPEGMKIWLFQGRQTGKKYSGQWYAIKGTVTKKAWLFGSKESETQRILKLTEGDLQILDSCFVKSPSEVELNAIRDVSERDEAVSISKNSRGLMTWKYVLQAFCEIPLIKPKVAGGDDLNCDDPWIFPLEIGIMKSSNRVAPHYTYYFRRPYGEKGEVPDWWFRATYFKSKGYIPAREAILNEKATNTPQRSGRPKSKK